MADVATSRVQLVDNSRRRADGKRIHKILPWQLVTLTDGPQMLEPTDVAASQPVASVTKEITGILFVDEGAFKNQNGTGGGLNGVY